MEIRRTLILLTGLTAALPALFVAGVTQRVSSRPPMQTYIVSEGSITHPAFGAIEAEQIANLSFQVPGQVVEVLVEDGDAVKAGDAIARLDNRAQYSAYEQANLNYELAVRQLEDLQSPDDEAIRLAEANLQAAQNAFTDLVNAVTDEAIAAAELRVQQAEEAQRAAEEARRYADPGRQTAETIALLDAQIGEASFNAEIARRQLEDLRSANQGELGAAGARIAQAQAELSRAQAGASEAEIREVQVAIDQAEVVLNRARLAYERTMLTAPFDGVVANTNLSVGQRVSAGATLLQLVDVSPLHFQGEVDEADIDQIAVGMEAQVKLEALPGVRFNGVLNWIAPQGRNEGGISVYDVEIDLATTDPRLRPGMSADADILVSDSGTLIVPNSFVYEDASGSFVEVLLPNGETQVRAVTLGARSENGVQIISGLHKGETIVLQ
jgi:HlyD family secretion protein